VAKQDLQLVGSEEATGACMLAVPETKVGGAGADEMSLILLPFLVAHMSESIGIEGFWIFEN
jgi:hypothetical protein